MKSSVTYVDVYFACPAKGGNDVTVTHTPSPIVSSSDYFAFGLQHTTGERAGVYEQRTLFQTQELQDKLNIGWVQFKWRNHDPSIGRFFNVDPLSEKFLYNSPYAFSENRVIDGIELEGLEWVRVNGNWSYDNSNPQGSKPVAAWTSTDECGVQSLNVGGPCGSIASYTSNGNGMVELPHTGNEQTGALTSGTFEIDGHTVYGYFNRNDINGGVEDQWGRPTDIADMINSIVEYNMTYPNDIIAIGDMRSPTNDQVSNTSTTNLHHNDQGAFDLRLLGNNGTMPPGSTVNSQGFSVAKTQTLVEALGNNNFTRFLINSNAATGLCSSGSISVVSRQDHLNHYHVDKR